MINATTKLMRSMVRFILLSVSICVAFTAPLANAAEQWHASKIFAVYVLASGDFVLAFQTDSSACTNTNSPRKYYYVTVGKTE